MRRLLTTMLPTLATAALMTTMVACGSDVTSSTSTPSSVVTTVPDSTVPVSTAPGSTAPGTSEVTLPPTDEPAVGLYFVRGEVLTVVGRSIGTLDPTAVMQALLVGPTAAEAAAGVRTLVPAGTELLGVTVEGAAATVDLTAPFDSGGGSLAVMLTVAQVTYTLTQLSGIDEVWFRIDGEPRDTLTGEGVMVDPATRARFQDGVLPNILLEQPFDGSAVADPLRIAGVTNAFEATVNYRVLDASGAVVVEGMTMATCGTGCWGTFTTDIDLPAGTTGVLTLQVFDYSEADGTTMLDLAEVAIRA